MLALQFNTNVLIKEQQRHYPKASFQRRCPKSDWKGTFFPIDKEEVYFNYMDNERIKDASAFQMGLLSAIFIACRCKYTETWTPEDITSLERVIFKMGPRYSTNLYMSYNNGVSNNMTICVC